MDPFIQQDPFESDQDEWDWFDLSLGINPPPTDVPCHGFSLISKVARGRKMRIQSRRSGRMVEESMDSLGIDSRWLDIRVTTGREEERSTTELLATSCKGKGKTTFRTFLLKGKAIVESKASPVPMTVGGGKVETVVLEAVPGEVRVVNIRNIPAKLEQRRRVCILPGGYRAEPSERRQRQREDQGRDGSADERVINTAREESERPKTPWLD
ncbi:hypothetical protein QVD17_42416 [Tagetes erecta]|uniref:Uncharacterized protein n=1 Tax=Tagetes erecta TaxID=13708 RepID=A0AAD8NEG9_TARER|nr:hypothetical protein QVD17_42416 [Tagetes erecta]